jgi:hypothetical protein
MNHPKPEQWATYVCGEATSQLRRQLQAHLEDCPECRRHVERWQRSASRLKAWKLLSVRTSLRLASRLEWAVAALVVLAIGFALGRFAGTDAVVEKARARLEPQLRQSLREEMDQLVHHEIGRSSSAILLASGDQAEKLLAAYNAVNETRRGEDLERLYLALKKQLDTVAINTEHEFVQLAGYQLPATEPLSR